MQIDEAALQSIEPAAVLDSAIVPIRDFVSPEELHRDLIADYTEISSVSRYFHGGKGISDCCGST